MKKTVVIFIVLLAIKLVLQHLLIHSDYDLQRDEYLHLDQGKHLAWGYISVPPVTSWISWIINFLGDSTFWVKFFPALFGTLTIVVVWKIIKELNGNLFAQAMGCLATLFSVLLRINILYQPNSLDIFFWTLTYFCVIKYINNNNYKWLFATALAIGFGFLSKYNIVFLVIGLLIGLLLNQSKVFKEKRLYAAGLVTLIIVLPNILWQVNNHFPTFHQLKELSTTQLANVKRADFVKEQVLYFLNSIFVIVIAFVGFLIYPPFKKYRFVLWSYLVVIGLYIFFKAKSYYAIGLYPVLIAFGSVYVEHLLKSGWKMYLKPVAIIFILGLFIPLLLIAFPIKSPAEIEKHNLVYKKFGLLRWEDGKDHNLPQDFADMVGWSDLARKVDSVYSQLAQKENTLIFCDNYGEAGAINYYSKFKNVNAVTMSADYINWIPLVKPIINVILIQEASDDDPQRNKEKPWFNKIEMVGTNDNPYSREQGTKIYLLQGARTNINSILAREVQKNKIH